VIFFLLCGVLAWVVPLGWRMGGTTGAGDGRHCRLTTPRVVPFAVG
jgi:hypothetical protein